MGKTYTRAYRIGASQTDLTAHLRPGALLEIMQELAGDHAASLGAGRDELLDRNFAWVLTRMEVHMACYPHFGEEMTAETFPMPNRRVFFPRYFLFRDGQGRQIGYAGSMWVLMELSARKMVFDADIARRLPDNSDLTAPMGMPATVEELPCPAAEALHTPVYTDLDMNGHVNNTRYVDWCCNALGIDVMRTHALTHFAVNYAHEILPGQPVRTLLRREGGRFSFSGFEGDCRFFDVGGEFTPLQQEGPCA